MRDTCKKENMKKSDDFIGYDNLMSLVKEVHLVESI